MKKRGIMIATIVVVVLVGAGAIVYAMATKKSSGQTASDEYSSATVARGTIQLTVPASGKLEPKTITTVRPDSNMPTRKIVAILVKAGDAVVGGQAVARIDDSGLDIELRSALANYNAAKLKLQDLKDAPTADDKSQAESELKQAQLALQNAKITYDGTKSLVDKGLASSAQLLTDEKTLTAAQSGLVSAQTNYDTVMAGTAADVMNAQESTVAQAENSYLTAKLAYDSTTIRSPVTGTVSSVAVNLGDLAGPSTTIVTVTQNNPMVLQGLVDEADIATVTLGQAATVTTYAYPNDTLHGTVTELSQTADTQGNVTSRTVSIDIPNPDGKLLWGMNADAEIVVLHEPNVLTLPNAAIQQSGGQATVLIRDAGDVIPWDVKIGSTDGSRTAVLAGLAEGDEVLIQKRSTVQRSTQSSQQGNSNAFMFRAFR